MPSDNHVKSAEKTQARTRPDALWISRTAPAAESIDNLADDLAEADEALVLRDFRREKPEQSSALQVVIDFDQRDTGFGQLDSRAG
jgi:hypothetical protein